MSSIFPEGVGATVVPAFFPFPKNNKLPLNSKHPVVVKEKQQLSIWSFVMVVCGVAAIMILLLTIGLVVARRCRDMKSPELKKDPEQIYEKIPSHGGNLVAVWRLGKLILPQPGISSGGRDWNYYPGSLGPVLLLRHDAVARILANGSAAFFESCAVIGWKDCDRVRSL